MQAERAQGHRALAAKTASEAVASEAEAAKADAMVVAAEERARQLERGEEVQAGFAKPMTVEEFIAFIGPKLARRAVRLAKLGEVGAFEEVVTEIRRRHKHVEDAVIRAMYKKYFG